MTDAAFEDADAMLREMGMTELLSRSDDLFKQGRGDEAVREARAFKARVGNG